MEPYDLFRRETERLGDLSTRRGAKLFGSLELRIGRLGNVRRFREPDELFVGLVRKNGILWRTLGIANKRKTEKNEGLHTADTAEKRKKLR
jgi:hypothetical protein